MSSSTYSSFWHARRTLVGVALKWHYFCNFCKKARWALHLAPWSPLFNMLTRYFMNLGKKLTVTAFFAFSFLLFCFLFIFFIFIINLFIFPQQYPLVFISDKIEKQSIEVMALQTFYWEIIESKLNLEMKVVKNESLKML